MTHAYAESYLNDAMENLGEAFDYAVNACMIDIETFMGLFISSGYANLFGKGVPKVVSGLSGTELVMEVVNKAGTFYSFPKPQVEYDYSPEYWCGWILAYYQWKTGRTFKDKQSLVNTMIYRRMQKVTVKVYRQGEENTGSLLASMETDIMQ